MGPGHTKAEMFLASQALPLDCALVAQPHTLSIGLRS